jgi:EAL domain-containing protein (putative c-di-GMP-specific phosphodiesterase class I)
MAGAVARARALAGTLAARSEVAGVQLSVEASVGVVVDTAGAVDLTELLRRADIAMYQAKRGGASVAWYDPARDRASTDRLSLLAELREALAGTDQLTLVMQPAVGLADGGATGVEALIRWQHPRRGTLMPADFVPVVEHSELLGQFTRYVLDRALAVAAGWTAEGLDVPVAVNMSPRSLLDPNLPDEVAALLEKHGTRPDRLVLEITETVVMSELGVIDDVLTTLRGLGVQLAVDDFGTGYSSLTFLTRVPVDEVKIDRSFVQRMVESAEVAAIVRTTVDLAHRLDLRVVAEGVETAEQRAALTALGCTAAQGFHFYRPMQPEQVTEVLHELTSAKVLKLRKDLGSA